MYPSVDAMLCGVRTIDAPAASLLVMCYYTAGLLIDPKYYDAYFISVASELWWNVPAIGVFMPLGAGAALIAADIAVAPRTFWSQVRLNKPWLCRFGAATSVAIGALLLLFAP